MAFCFVVLFSCEYYFFFATNSVATSISPLLFTRYVFVALFQNIPNTAGKKFLPLNTANISYLIPPLTGKPLSLSQCLY